MQVSTYVYRLPRAGRPFIRRFECSICSLGQPPSYPVQPKRLVAEPGNGRFTFFLVLAANVRRTRLCVLIVDVHHSREILDHPDDVKMR